MICSNTVSNGKYMDLFLKGLSLKPHTEYILTFRVKGGACFVRVNRYFSNKGAEPYFTYPCTAWETHRLQFTTNSLAYKHEAVEDWCISFGKKPGTRYATAGEDTYVDDVHLYLAADPAIDLLTGGSFEAPRADEIYAKNWLQSFFGPTGDTYGVDIVTDPDNENNRCLKLPALQKAPAFPELIPLRTEGFGWHKDNIDHVTESEPFGLPHHRLLLVENGTITCETLDAPVTANSGELLYLPPSVPVQYTYTRGEGTSYYWVDISGESIVPLLAECGLQGITACAIRHIETLTAHIDAMLEHPRDDAFYPYVLSGRLQLLLAQLHHLMTTETENRHPAIEQAAACLREFSNDPPDNTVLAERFGFSTRHFIRLFKQYKGCTPHQYYLQAQMDRACALLSDTGMTVQEVSFALGMDDAFYFSRLFRKFYGISPTEYRSLKD